MIAAWWISQDFIRQLAHQELRQISRGMPVIGAFDGTTIDIKTQQRLQVYLHAINHLEEITFVDKNDNVVQRFSKDYRESDESGEKNLFTVLHNSLSTIAINQSTAIAKFPVIYPGIDNIDQGYWLVRIDLRGYQSRLAETLKQGALIIMLVFVFGVLVIKRMLHEALKPLQALQEPLQKLAKGETNIEVSKAGGDEEIVAISRTLYTTISAVQGRDEELRRLADYDALTGLVNKRSFMSLLAKECARVVEEKDSSALLFLDLDQFKFINDTVGHAGGDRLLVQVAELLGKRMREDDCVARLGGDEFAVLARSVEQGNALEIAADLIQALQDYVFIDGGQSFNIYCSIGVVIINQNQSIPADIMSNANMTCYAAKSKGRNCYECFDMLADEVPQLDMGWSQRISEALSKDHFVLHFQPLLATQQQWAASFEVLLRLNDQQRGIVSPTMFLSIAERFGLALEIDYWVIRRSLQMLEQYNSQGYSYRFYINLSGQVFSDPVFVEQISSMLETFDVDPTQIVFEVTERAAIGNIQSACKKMEDLRAIGIQFALDDFGAGYSSFSYLKHLPVDSVKIEGEIVSRLNSDEFDRTLVKAIIELARASGKKVIAEYVSDYATFSLLSDYGVDYMQGFYIARPAAEPREITLSDIVLSGEAQA